MGRRAAGLIAILALGACATAPAFGPLRLPYWLEGSGPASPILQLTQSATFAEPGIRICRRLRNIGTQPVAIRTLAAEGDSAGVLGVHFFDLRGRWIEPEWPPGFIPSLPGPPPPPRYEGDISIYTVLEPGQHADNCKGYELPPRRRFFQAVTTFSSDVDLEFVPERLRAGRIVIDRRAGFLVSAPCRIDTRAREVRC